MVIFDATQPSIALHAGGVASPKIWGSKYLILV